MSGEIVTFVCGPSSRECRCQCPDGPCEHEWTGEVVTRDDEGRVRGASMACSRCGMTAMGHDLVVGP